MGILVLNAAITTTLGSLRTGNLPVAITIQYAPAPENRHGMTYLETGRDLVALLRRMGWPDGREMRAQWAPVPAAPVTARTDVHTAMSQASQAAYALGAQAYAVGNQLSFGAGPTDSIVAHELTHVVQQNRGK